MHHLHSIARVIKQVVGLGFPMHEIRLDQREVGLAEQSQQVVVRPLASVPAGFYGHWNSPCCGRILPLTSDSCVHKWTDKPRQRVMVSCSEPTDVNFASELG